jgi:hypothetical protein
MPTKVKTKVKTPIVRKNRIDWPQFKSMFLVQDKSVVEFLADKGINYRSNSNAAVKTRSWTKARQEVRERMLDKASEKIEDMMIKSFAKAKKAKFLFLDKLSQQLIDYSEDKTQLSAAEARIYWEIVKVELNEPTTVTKTTNENRQIDFTFVSNLTAQNSNQPPTLPTTETVDVLPKKSDT